MFGGLYTIKVMRRFLNKALYRIRFLAYLASHSGRKTPAPARMQISIEEICAKDSGHLSIDEEHQKGVEAVKKEILRGRPILPVLVREFSNAMNPGHCGLPYNAKHGLPTHYKYQRLDGFKRFMAYKELGYRSIDCYVDNAGFPGGQHKMPWIVWSERMALMEYQFIKGLGEKVFHMNAE